MDDWSALIGRFESGAVGVWEGSTLMKGHYNDGFGFEWAEVNGSEGSAVYRLTEPNTILIGRHNQSLKSVPVPAEFLIAKGSREIRAKGFQARSFGMTWFGNSSLPLSKVAMRSRASTRCVSAQLVADKVLESFERQTWVTVDGKLG